MTESTVFYCEMCKEKHSRIEPRAQCPTCGRTFCHDSLADVIAVNVKKCPYCDKLLKEFTGLSWELKSQLTPATEYVPPENAKKSKKPQPRNLKNAGRKVTRTDEAWSNERSPARVQMSEKRRAMNYNPFKKTRRSSGKRRKRGKPNMFGMSGSTQVFAVFLAFIFIFLLYQTNPDVFPDLEELQNFETAPLVDCKFQFELAGDTWGDVTDGWISVYEDNTSDMILETAEIRYSSFTSARYYDPEAHFHIRYSGSLIWAEQNRSLLLADDFIWGRSDFPTEPATVQITDMFLDRINATG